MPTLIEQFAASTPEAPFPESQFPELAAEVRDRILEQMKQEYPDLSFYAVVDSDYSTSESPEKAEKKDRKRGKNHGTDE